MARNEVVQILELATVAGFGLAENVSVNMVVDIGLAAEEVVVAN